MMQTIAIVMHSADVDESARLGQGTRVWHLAQVREGAEVGAWCVIARGAYIDHHVILGDCCKVGNYACVYAPARLGRGVFVGPGALLLNDPYPRAMRADGRLKSVDDWSPAGVTVGDGASIGARVVVLPGVTIGKYAMIGAGSVVTRDVPAHGLYHGGPATEHGRVCVCGRPQQAGRCAECD